MKKLLFLLPLAFIVNAHASIDTDKTLALGFTQDFYDWYLKDNDAFDHVIKAKGAKLEPHFLAQLKKSRQCAAKGNVCEDSDPFLQSQDPCSKYEVADVAYKNQKYIVTMQGDCGQSIKVPLIKKNNSFLMLRPYH